MVAISDQNRGDRMVGGHILQYSHSIFAITSFGLPSAGRATSQQRVLFRFQSPYRKNA